MDREVVEPPRHERAPELVLVREVEQVDVLAHLVRVRVAVRGRVRVRVRVRVRARARARVRVRGED